MDRLNDAIARIEAAAKAIADRNAALGADNEALRDSLRGAIATLDTIINEQAPS